MRYHNIIPARFIARPNRFIAVAEVEGAEVKAHVKNTGRCRELLVPDATIYLEESDNPARKTKYSLVGVEKQGRLINMDSQAPNKVVEEALYSGWRPSCWAGRELAAIRREVTWGNSRLDFVLESGGEQLLVEVKGVTLEQDGAVYFPDAPTERGIKHIKELEAGVAQGYSSCVLFVVQMEDVHFFAPNDTTHPAFGAALRQAAANGVSVEAWTCFVTSDSLVLDKEIPVEL